MMFEMLKGLWPKKVPANDRPLGCMDAAVGGGVQGCSSGFRKNVQRFQGGLVFKAHIAWIQTSRLSMNNSLCKG